MRKLQEIAEALRGYDGEPLTFMEVCGTHTASISQNGIADMLSPKIKLVSGPGCPVCVTVASYIDRLTELSREENTCVVTFGDMLRVRGSRQSLREAAAEGGNVRMVYSPIEVIGLALENPGTRYVFAAVGFETTAPVYAILAEEAVSRGISNIRLLTALKTMPAVIDRICGEPNELSGFIAPGHVSVVTGSRAFLPLAEKYGLPFVVAGFEGGELLAAVYALVKLKGRAGVYNFYPRAVSEEGNVRAREKVEKYFEPCDAAWRGMGIIPSSGMRLRKEYAALDAGSGGLFEDAAFNKGCSCPDVLTGRLSPTKCPLYGSVCTPDNPQGACMVSSEGSCFNYFVGKRG
ncbi:MAG: hydrogenase formation protein HypD [Butyrivibrio sp.]|nr:hydrogenase formation protein HypD [Butyrivibrio sp.]